MHELRPLHPTLAAELVGLPPNLAVDAATFAAIEAAWQRDPVLVFRDLVMTPEQQVAFSRRFGPLHIMAPEKYNLDGHPEIFVVSNASSSVSGGRMVARRFASIDLPVPGGPISRTL